MLGSLLPYENQLLKPFSTKDLVRQYDFMCRLRATEAIEWSPYPVMTRQPNLIFDNFKPGRIKAFQASRRHLKDLRQSTAHTYCRLSTTDDTQVEASRPQVDRRLLAVSPS